MRVFKEFYLMILSLDGKSVFCFCMLFLLALRSIGTIMPLQRNLFIETHFIVKISVKSLLKYVLSH